MRVIYSRLSYKRTPDSYQIIMKQYKIVLSMWHSMPSGREIVFEVNLSELLNIKARSYGQARRFLKKESPSHISTSLKDNSSQHLENSDHNTWQVQHKGEIICFCSSSESLSLSLQNRPCRATDGCRILWWKVFYHTRPKRRAQNQEPAKSNRALPQWFTFCPAGPTT